MSEHMMPIPSRIYNAAVGGHVCGPEDVDFGQKVVHLVKYDRSGNEVSFESQVTQANKIYVIHDDFVLSDNITIPANCVLEFEGGSITSDTYTLTGANTTIEAPLYPIFPEISLAGTFATKGLFLDWFGTSSDCSLKFIAALNATKTLYNGNSNNGVYYITLGAKVYEFNTQIDLDDIFGNAPAYLHIKGQGESSIIKNNYGGTTYGGTMEGVDYLFEAKKTSGSGANQLIDIKLSDFIVWGKTDVEDNNQGFLYEPLGWVNDADIHDIKTWYLATVFYINRAYWIKIHQCCFREGVNLLYLTESNSCSYTNNQFRGCTGIALCINGGHGTNITGNDFSGDHIGLKVMGGLSYAFSITGNYFEVGSHSQQNYELVLGDSITDKFQNFTIANNSGLDYVSKWDENYYQFYGLVVNGSIFNCLLNCSVAKIAYGKCNFGCINLNDELVQEDSIKDYFTWYNVIYESDKMYLNRIELFHDSRHLENRIKNIEVELNLVKAIQSSEINTKLVWEDIYGTVYEQASLDSYDYFRNASRKTIVKIVHNMKRTTSYTQELFDGCTKLESVPPFKVASSAYKLFNGCTSLKYIPVLDLSECTNAAFLVAASGIIEFPLMDTSNIENASYMFQACECLRKIPLLDFSNVTSVDGMLGKCTQLRDIGGFKNLKYTLNMNQNRWITPKSIENIIDYAYNWSTNPSSLPTPSSTPTVFVTSEVMNTLSNEIKAKFPAKGWAISLWS